MSICKKLALGLAVACLLAPALHADDYPSRPVRIIIGFGPGASADITARVLAQRFNQKLGQQFVVENRPGAGSSLAAEFVARAPKDGYTLFMATIANTINSAISSNLNFDFAKDLAPIALIATVPNILVVHPSLGVNNVRDLIALAKSKPEQITYGSSGVGTLTHVSVELFNSMAGVKFVHVPYPGSAQAVADLLAGRIQVSFSPASTVMPHVAEGKLLALASTAMKRASVAPNLPTMAEAGLPGFETGLWFGLLAPAGTPRAIIDKLAAAANEALQASEVMAPLRPQGIDPLGGTPEEFARYIAAETQKWADVAKAAGLKK
jgi:tripartite-type tricarboxylate transporter receptor subunit TctC